MPRLALSNVNLNLLVALDAVLTTRSVSEAARRARVTTSAMSHSLAALRSLFEDPLLVRIGGRMALTPYADSLREPLAQVLGSVTRMLEGARAFEPAKAERRFVIAAPDFFSTLILPSVIQVMRDEAPRIELSIVPSARRGNAWMLESGELDLALGAVVEDAPGVHRAVLCTETFACAVRRDHPEIGETLSLDVYARLRHLVIALGDDEEPTWVDEALAKKGRRRDVAVRVRYFMAAPLLVASTDLIFTGPAMLIDYFAKLVPLRVLRPPISLPTYAEEMYWHERYDADPSHRWLRELIVRVTSQLGTGEQPERRRWTLEGAQKTRSKARPPRR